MLDAILVALVAGTVFAAMAFAAGWFGLWKPHDHWFDDDDETEEEDARTP